MTTPTDDGSQDYAADLKQTVTEITKYRDPYRKAYRYWRGKQPEVFSTPAVQAALALDEGQFSVSVGKRVVASVTDRLEILSIKATPASAQTALDEVMDANKMDLQTPDLVRDTAMYGDMYVRAWYDPDDENAVEIVQLTPDTCRAFYQVENPNKLDFVGQTWQRKDKFRRVNLYYGDKIVQFITRKAEDDGAGGPPCEMAEYQPYANDDGEYEIPNETGRPPVFHFRNDRPYGISELEDAYGAQNILTKEINVMMDATDGYAFPFRAALSKSGTQGQQQNAVSGWDDADDVELDGVTRKRGPHVRMKPGDIAEFQDTDALVSLPPAPVGSFTEPIRLALELVNTVTGKTIYNHNQTRTDSSGIAQQERDKSLINTVETYQRYLGAELKDLYEYTLALIGHGDVQVKITWDQAQLTDDQQAAVIAKAKQDAGVPQPVTLKEMGYLEETVDQWAEGTESTNLLERIDLINKLGTAGQGLGAAKQLGVFSDDQINAVMTFVLQGIAPDVPENDQPDPVVEPPAPPVVDPTLPDLPAAGA